MFCFHIILLSTYVPKYLTSFFRGNALLFIYTSGVNRESYLARFTFIDVNAPGLEGRYCKLDAAC